MRLILIETMAKPLFLLLLAITIANSYPSLTFRRLFENNQHRIGGGTTAQRGQFPYIVSLRRITANMAHVCGGSILNERFVLTAAHCIVYVRYILKDQYIVQVGAHHVRNDGVQHTIRRGIIHEDLDMSKASNDIALIELKDPIVFGPNVQPIQLESEFVSVR